MADSKPQNLSQILLEQIRISGQKTAFQLAYSPAIETKRLWTWQELGLRIRSVAAGLLSLGLKKGHRLVLYTPSDLAWVLMDLATLAIGGVSVPVHPNTPLKTLQKILQETEAMFLVVPNQEGWEMALDMLHSMPHLQRVITAEPIRGDAEIQLDLQELEARGLQGLEKAGMLIEGGPGGDLLKHAGEMVEPHRDAILCWREHHGEISLIPLTHANLMTQVRQLQHALPASGSESALQTLSYATIFGRMEMLWHLGSGESVMLSVPDGETWSISEPVSPTVIFSDPAALASLQHMKNVQASSKAQIFCAGDYLAPTLKNVFVEKGFSVRDVYGLPEFSGWGTLDGGALPETHVRVNENQEIFVRGTSLFQGYGVSSADPEMPANRFDGEWFNTGDLGNLDPQAGLHFLSHAKDCVLTPTGERVYLTKIEAELLANDKSGLIRRAVIVGEAQPYLIALVLLNFNILKAKPEWGFMMQTTEWTQNAELRQILQTQFDAFNLNLSESQQIKRFAILPQDLNLIDIPDRKTLERTNQKLIESLYR